MLFRSKLLEFKNVADKILAFILLEIYKNLASLFHNKLDDNDKLPNEFPYNIQSNGI